jgi:hypothetical protein
MRLQKLSDLVNNATGWLPPNTARFNIQIVLTNTRNSIWADFHLFETFRAIGIVLSLENGDPEMYPETFKAWEKGIQAIADVESLQIVLLIQPHPVTNGTNSLGLGLGQKDEIMFVIIGSYNQAEDDEVLQAGMEAIAAAHEVSLK